MRRLEIDLSAPGAGRFAADLGRGGLFVAGHGGAEVDDEWEVLLLGGEAPVGLIARVVFADATGVGLQLTLGTAIRDRLAALASAAPPEDGSDPIVSCGDGDGTDAEPGPEDGEEDEDQRQVPRNVYERLRGMNLNQQYKVAREGELQERVALERIYGKTVWELLLRNPRITAPEVARLARKGTLPRTNLEIIVSNGAWLGVPEVRRALLANPRLTPEMIPRVLRHLPKQELKLVPIQLAYPAIVREAARRLLRGAAP